ncbi:UDP-N-acetylmuramoyl-tripeptide--D-alanyl-D-alanine ligase [Colwellia sp. MB02u-18]|uniref:UDP-N-acetylmuramoyl-tripeptide--D-alanyl-D- alanine ligase n=1 Tax=unclassified Colwellia TaxID=196834 RepID=UPI0015F4E5AD|nr:MULTISPECIES: UDP-N-acetylmuramoyl-tripeptide--D-alanyl-D-alanine ligase [unclassified Colwellia]MBA6223777.1 UDP-N-acetylmuramoyl-tripeptide--D-alanyl-D-alanine ligase [Colwellia sp. MB3u-45]MBA6268507.1 UDP-N-acetylmuramoyl-tripeptide--D-alanyl-D-alanine ligase [Colwellia sp. MB3u-43]MBA6293426.1 UDP-N-acetylmuramoyl-tripeptide--D-alanyl-D-alanine ligase [Colwellia sp. MB3u-8]MBA6307988.1 UDP-N-acetylmuramoyl-tripeptide--D-alanyl-D-alanine ligase [Colwellia sp. MB3u-70]MBA6319958.1 UDP-N-
MISLSLTELSQAVNGQLIGENLTINAISTDSRALKAGDVFLALHGPNFDGHKFLTQASELGCSAVIVEQAQDKLNIAQIVVKDSHQALGDIAAYVKAKVAPKTVAITGSSGKTTVKEMVAAILNRLGNVLATKGNFNNDIGVPLTLLRLEQKHDFAVVELGANHIGEIAYTAALVKPDVAMINNIAAAHLEGFGDLCGVARAKGEIFSGLNAGGVAIYNQNTPWADKWQWRLTDKQVRRFSCQGSADCYSHQEVLDDNGCASFQLITPIGNTYIELTVPGHHNVCNAVAAATIALEFGASLDDIRLGLAAMAAVKGRLNLHQLSSKIKLIDDSYNANVESINAASDLLASYSGRRILILGDMGELGGEARRYHQEVGEHAKSKEIDDLLTLGVLSQNATDAFYRGRNTQAQHFSSKEKLMSRLQQLLQDEEQQVTLLVKGSRSAHMEYVVADIIKWHNSQTMQEQA